MAKKTSKLTTKAALQTVQNVTSSVDTFARTIPFLYERHSFGERKKTSMQRVEVETTEDEVKPNKKLLTLTKRLLEMPAINAIKMHDTHFRLYLKMEAGTPWKPGLYLIPVGLIQQVNDRAVQWEKVRGELVDAAAKVYAQCVSEMPAKLGPLFNADDYPTVEEFRAKYWVEWNWVDIGAPGVLKNVRADIYDRECKRVQRQAEQANEAIQQHLRVSLLKITEHLRYLLTPKADGKPKGLRDDSLNDLMGFLDTATLRSAPDDKGLLNVVKQLKALSKGFDVERIKGDVALREEIATAMSDAKQQLESMVIVKPRAIRVRD